MPGRKTGTDTILQVDDLHLERGGQSILRGVTLVEALGIARSKMEALQARLGS